MRKWKIKDISVWIRKWHILAEQVRLQTSKEKKKLFHPQVLPVNFSETFSLESLSNVRRPINTALKGEISKFLVTGHSSWLLAIITWLDLRPGLHWLELRWVSNDLRLDLLTQRLLLSRLLETSADWRHKTNSTAPRLLRSVSVVYSLDIIS